MLQTGAMRARQLITPLTIGLGALSFGIVLAVFRVIDGDLWARLAVGKLGAIPRHDAWAFTPVLPDWIDHEWGAGFVFYALYHLFGESGLMLFKIAAALGAVALCLATARRAGVEWPALLALALPCAFAILPGFIPVVRSHAFTFLFFALTLWCWPKHRWVIPLILMVWVNVHGGFVVGLILVAVLAWRQPVILLASLAATLVNPYGLRYWTYLIPAILHPRTDIAEWGPMPLTLTSPYAGYWLLLVVVVIFGWKTWRNPPGLILLVLTAIAAALHRRHVPFFGLTALVFVGPCLPRIRQEFVLGLYGAVAAAVLMWLWPKASLTPTAPASFYPVGAVDYLEHTGATGNLAVPFRWGSYASWRLFPRLKVSIDGRYETVYPDSTFAMNHDFFYRQGKEWDRLLKQYRVDYIILDLKTTHLTPADLSERGYRLVWSDATAALWTTTSTPRPGS